MIIVCSNCSSRLQIDEAKSPPRPFSVRCPKCSYSVTAPVGAAVAESSAASVNSHEKAYREPPSPAPEFNLESTASEVHTTLSEAERIAQLLASIVAQKAGTGAEGLNDRAAWNRRKVLVCTPEAHRESVARQL